MNIIPVILDQGNDLSKNFIKNNDNYSLLQNTIICFSVSYKNLIIVSNISNKKILIEQINELINKKIISDNISFTIYLEPIYRNTLPIVTLISLEYPDYKLLYIPCDNIYNIYNIENLNKNIILASKSEQNIIIFGIKSIYMNNCFGYIETNLESNFINKFIEKLNDKFVGQDNYFYNTGIFILESKNFINIINKFKPDIFNIINLSFNKSSVTDHIIFIEIDKNYLKCENISIYYDLFNHLLPKSVYFLELIDSNN